MGLKAGTQQTSPQFTLWISEASVLPSRMACRLAPLKSGLYSGAMVEKDYPQPYDSAWQLLDHMQDLPTSWQAAAFQRLCERLRWTTSVNVEDLVQVLEDVRDFEQRRHPSR